MEALHLATPNELDFGLLKNGIFSFYFIILVNLFGIFALCGDLNLL